MKTAIVFLILLLDSALAIDAQSQPSFTPAPGSPFAVGAVPLSVAVGDFNGDGYADLAAANSNNNNVTVLLGSASGAMTAAPGSPFAVGTNPSFVVAGDFNKDGHLDIAVANGNNSNPGVNSTITVLLGNGSGGFSLAPGNPTTVGMGSVSMAVGDFNGDGIPDLVTTNSVSDSVIVLLGNGSGGFTVAPGSPLVLISDAGSVAVGDFNKDGHQDIALGAGRGGVTVMLGNGTGGFSAAAGSPYAAGLNAGSVAVADFNRDGNLDIACANSNGSSNNVTVLLGNGSGGFTLSSGSPFAVGSTPGSIAAADFNGDGIPDLVTADEGANNVTVLLGNGAGGFTAASNSPFAVGSDPISVAVADFNGDGVPDLATANPGGSNVTVLLGSGARPIPAITPGGIVPVDSTVTTIQSGEWVSIYGTNLASSTVTWNGNFPLSLGGTSVTIDGKAAYLLYVSPGQIDLQSPSDTATGTVPVVVTTASGSVNATVTLAQVAPSFSLLDTKHIAGIILRSNGSGAYGGGTYDILGPTGSSLGYATVAARAGDIVELFGFGFGPTNPPVQPGQVYVGAAPTTNPVTLLINNVIVTPAFAGLSSAGVYQFNLTVPAGLGTGDASLVATVAGVQSQSSAVISLQ